MQAVEFCLRPDLGIAAVETIRGFGSIQLPHRRHIEIWD